MLKPPYQATRNALGARGAFEPVHQRFKGSLSSIIDPT